MRARVALAMLLMASSWRTGGAPLAGPLPDLDQAPGWRVPLPRWGNASPLLVKDQVCVTLEPTTLACFDAETGAERWRYPHEVLQAIPEAERASLAARLDEAARLEVEAQELTRTRSAAQRAARAGEPGARERSDALTARIGQIDATLRDLAWARTPDDKDILGYATPTPVSDGRDVWAFFANGVVARHGTDGRLVWMRWLGPPQASMRGFHTGESTSPVLAEGVLVVAHADLIGLDAATGAERWRLPGWRDYGTPALLQVAGHAWIATPDGRLVRVRDGVVAAKGVADVWYVGPHAEGDVVVWIGTAGPEQRDARAVPATAVRVHPSGDGVRVERLWSTTLVSADTFYTPPTTHRGRVFSVTKSGELRVLDLRTGAVLHEADLLPQLGGWIYASPVVVQDELVVFSASGRLLRIGTEPPFLVRSAHTLGGQQHRATPAFAPGRVWTRSGDAVGCVGCAR